MKEQVWKAFHTSENVLVKTASIVISTIVCRGGLGAWSDIIDMLTYELQSDSEM